MMSLPIFWCEIAFMAVTPLPMNNPDSFFGLKIVYLNCVNWAGYGGDDYPTGAHVYATPYLTNDIFLGAMFFRFFFVMQALVYTSPPNNKLVGKRVCHEMEIEPTFEFQVKTAFKERPGLLFFVSISFFMLALSSLIRIFERPYYEFNFPD